MNKNTTTVVKMSEVKKACNLVASLVDDASKEDKAIVKNLIDAIQDDKHIVELRNTTNCIMFVRDEHKNVLFNVYDSFRIQFTTQQAKKYKDALLKDDRFYTFTYKQKEFISAKSKDINDFIDLCKYCYKAIDTSEKATTTATKQEQKAKKNA